MNIVEHRPVAVVRVRYNNDLSAKDPMIGPVFRKRLSFSHEREIRVTAIEETGAPGLPIRLDMSTLIENMYIWPLAPAWMVGVFQKELRVHRINKTIIRSSLYDPIS